MATNRTRTSRNRKDVFQLDETIKEFLLSGKKPEKKTPAWGLYVSRFFDDSAKIKAAWMQHRHEIMAGWKRRGLPWAAKEFDNKKDAKIP